MFATGDRVLLGAGMVSVFEVVNVPEGATHAIVRAAQVYDGQDEDTARRTEAARYEFPTPLAKLVPAPA